MSEATRLDRAISQFSDNGSDPIIDAVQDAGMEELRAKAFTYADRGNMFAAFMMDILCQEVQARQRDRAAIIAALDGGA